MKNRFFNEIEKMSVLEISRYFEISNRTANYLKKNNTKDNLKIRLPLQKVINLLERQDN